jgi:hypothetical protein
LGGLRRLSVVAGDAERHSIVYIEMRAAVVDLDDVIGDEPDIYGSAVLAGKSVAAFDR